MWFSRYLGVDIEGLEEAVGGSPLFKIGNRSALTNVISFEETPE